MKNLKVSAKLLTSFIIVIVLAVLIGGVGIFGMMQINNASNHIYYEQLEPIANMGVANEYFQMVRVEARNIAIRSGDLAMVNSSYDNFVRVYESFHTHLEKFRPFLISEEGIRLGNEVYTLFNYEVIPGMYHVVEAARAGAPTLEIMDIMASTTAAADQITINLDRIMTLRMNAAEAAAISNNSLFRLLLWVIIGVLVISVVVAIMLALYISGLISKPLAPLATFFNRAAATGDIDFTTDEAVAVKRFQEHKDEIGQLSGAVSAFMDEIRHEMDMLDHVADGDLTIEPNVLSDKDIVGKALRKVLDNLNNTLGEVGNASRQVSGGAQQIADGSQSLAQGSTEQAATVQELSASAAEISDQTRVNAEKAEKAYGLATTIKGNAEKGSRQMDEMVNAVNEISQASQSISKVIKVIDDIAFQTNILALNAAVEAARAGQHGKGFAVVADEVRTLAAKSAEAAKDTGALISNSMEKAELGARIASETAVSLAEIVAGINESSEIIEEIAKASEVQAAGIGQINSAIDQVAMVVQQNSATAEESAAAAEELSGQSTMLVDLVSQFKMKDGNQGGARADAPSAGYRASGSTSFAVSMGGADKY